MSKANILLVLLLLLLLLLSSHHLVIFAKPSSDPNPKAGNFIETKCRATLYPSLCIQSLSNYSKVVLRSPKQLALAALSVSLSRAQSVSSFLYNLSLMRGMKPVERRAVKDCSANMAGAVDQLSRSLKELGGMAMGPQAQGLMTSWHRSNVESWVGAAITFGQTCVDSFESPVMDGNVKIVVRKRVLECAHLSSNALALIHRYIYAAPNFP